MTRKYPALPTSRSGRQAPAFALGPLDVPEEAIEMGATLLIDTLGVGAGAVDLEPARIARNHAVRFMSAGGPEDAATLLFDGRRASIPGACFALATQIDNLDAHDGYNPTKGHVGCAVEKWPEILSRFDAIPVYR